MSKHAQTMERVRALLERAAPTRRRPAYPDDGRVRDAAEIATKQWERDREAAIRQLAKDAQGACAVLLLHDWTASPKTLVEGLGDDYRDLVVVDASRWVRTSAPRIEAACSGGEFSAAAYSRTVEEVQSRGFQLDLRLRSDKWPDAKDVGMRVEPGVTAYELAWRYMECMYGDTGVDTALQYEVATALLEGESSVPAMIVLAGVPPEVRSAVGRGQWLAFGETTREAKPEAVIDALRKIRDKARKAMEAT